MLRRVRVVVLRAERAVLGRPVGWVVGLPERVAHAGVAGGEHAGARVLDGQVVERRALWGAAAADGGTGGLLGGEVAVVELELHELVHVTEDEHVRVELDDAGVLRQGKGGELAPAVVEARVVGVVAALCREEVLDALGGDAAALESGEALGGEGVCVEGNKGVG